MLNPFIVFGGGSYDSSTIALINKAESLGYTKPSNLNPLDNLIKGLKNINVWAKLDLFYLLAHDMPTSEANFRRLNIINPDAYQLTFEGGWTFGKSGAIGNGTNTRIRTGFTPLVSSGNYSVNSATRFATIYENTNTPENINQTGIDSVSGQTSFQLIASTNTGSRTHSVNSAGGASVDLSGNGFKAIVRRTDTETFTKSKAQVFTPIGTNSVDTTTYPSEILVGQRGANYTNMIFSQYAIGSALTNTELDGIRGLINAYYLELSLSQIA